MTADPINPAHYKGIPTMTDYPTAAKILATTAADLTPAEQRALQWATRTLDNLADDTSSEEAEAAAHFITATLVEAAPDTRPPHLRRPHPRPGPRGSPRPTRSSPTGRHPGSSPGAGTGPTGPKQRTGDRLTCERPTVGIIPPRLRPNLRSAGREGDTRE